MVFSATHISVSISKRVEEVYAFAADPRNLPTWASGLADSELSHEGESWIASSPMGKVTVRFAPKNPFGVLDHEVTLPDGETNFNPLRVVSNGSGCEVIFTLYRLPDRSDEDFLKDSRHVQKDLLCLKSILENKT